MTRFTWIAVATSVALAGVAAAQSQAELAAKLNDEGKELMYAQKYAEASAKFAEAVARVPEAKYFFNLCTSRFQEGKFGEALTACNAVGNNNPPAELRAKTDKLTTKIKDEAKSQGLDLQPAGGGGGSTDVVPPDPQHPPDPNDPNHAVTTTPVATNPPPVVGRAPTQGLFTAVAPSMKYTWTLGVDLYAGGGSVGQKDVYGSTNQGLRIKGDYMLNAASRIGAQGYLQITHFQSGTNQAFTANDLDIVDIGIAAYKHLCPANSHLCLTPLAGVQLALMSPANMTDGAGSQVFNYSALGARVEVSAQYAFGTRFEHVISAFIGANLYSKVFGNPSDGSATAMEVGLDKGGAAGYAGVGYTYRFNTPLGSSPFVTLE